MTIDQIIEIEIRTGELIVQLEEEIEEAAAHSAPPSQLNGTEGRLSRQDSMIHHEIAKDAQRRRQARLTLLREAIKRMNAGEYGFCSNCRNEIEFARLEIQPETQICGSCAALI